MARLRGTDDDDRLEGDDEDDEIYGRDGNDRLIGRGGDDRIVGGSGNDVIHGNDGDDELHGRTGDDRIIGGDGDDRITGSGGDDRLYGQGGDDDLRGYGDDDRIDGGSGADRVNAGPGEDTITGASGGDRLIGARGDDRIYGEGGDDNLRGYGDNDRIDGGRGADRVNGGIGEDTLTGGSGDDLIVGARGDDRIYGDGDDDDLNGNRGNDRIEGGSGDDRIDGDDGDDQLQGQAGADVLTGGPGADKFFYSSLSHRGDVITDFSPDEGDALRLIGSLDGAEVRMVADGDDTRVSVRPDGAQNFSELVVLENYLEDQPPAADDPPPSSSGPIDVWYGDTQTFGDPGEAQRWVNVLGDVPPDGLTSLTYSLNGGPEQDLAVGVDGFRGNPRLGKAGDFNVELDYDQLRASAADDVVTIRAAYANGDVFERDVTLAYESGNRWPTDYSIDWSEVRDLQDVVQVVDGNWSFDDSGVRPAEIEYDRVLAIGDTRWDSYEAAFSVEIHSLTHPTVAGAAMWFGMQWGGHTDDPIAGAVPHAGYVPGATFMVQSEGVVLRPSEFFDDRIPENPRVGRGADFEDGQTYEFLIRNQRVAGDTNLGDGLDRTYSLKVWRAGDPEPADWYIQQTMVDQEPFGSFLLNAHYVDVTFGDIDFTPLPRDDVLPQDDSLETMLVANSSSAPADEPAGQESGRGGSTEPVGGSSGNLSDLLTSGDEAALVA